MKKWIATLLTLVLLTASVSGIETSQRTVYAADYTTASILSFTGTWSSEKWITETNSEHWYKLVIPSDGRVTMKVMSYIGGYYGTCYSLYDKEFTSELYYEYTGGGSLSQPNTNSSDFDLSAGTYYLKVTGRNGNVGKYKLNATFENYSVNDKQAVSYDSPQSYSLGSQITGAITVTDKEDWYKVVISSAAHYVINMKSYIGGYYGTCYDLYNEDLSSELYYNNTSGGSLSQPNTTNTDYVLDKGVYYLKVTGRNGNTGKYIFTLARLTQANCSHDYAETDVDATYISRGYTLHKCKKCGKSFKDSYTAKRTLSQGYIWSYGMQPGKRKIKVLYQGISDVSGYQLRYSTDKKFKKAVKIVKAGKSKTTKTIKALKKRKRYYVQVRGYKKIKGKVVYGKWSAKRSAKTR